METLQAVFDTVENMISTVSESTNTDPSTNASTEQTAPNTHDDDQVEQANNGTTLINIDQLNSNIAFPWKIRTIINCEYPKRTFMNTHGTGEVSSWDLVDETGAITLVAFNLNSTLMSDKLKKDKAYEFTGLTIRPTSDTYKTLSHSFQLVCTSATRSQEIDLPFDYRMTYDFTHLDQVETIPLNSIIDVQIRVLREYGIVTGTTNDNIWSRREIHVDQDGIHLGMTLWNEQARHIDRNMAGLEVKFKNVKVSWFNGVRTLVTMGNTQLTTIQK